MADKTRYFGLSLGGSYELIVTREQLLIYLDEIDLDDVVRIKALELTQEEYNATPDVDEDGFLEDGSQI